MKYLSSLVGNTKFVAPIRSIYLERQTGILEIEGPSLRKRLYFVGGELHLRRSDLPLAKRIATFLGEDGEAQSPVAAGSADAGEDNLRILTTLIAEHWTVWEATSVRFIEGLDLRVSDLLGPLPTARLLSAAARATNAKDQILDLLGGPKAMVVAVATADAPRGSTVSRIEDALFLELCREPVEVDVLLQRADSSRDRALLTLSRLWVIGLVRPFLPSEVVAEPLASTENAEVPPLEPSDRRPEATAPGTSQIWQEHFRLSADPFSLTPDPAFLFLSKGHAEGLAALKLGLLERRGLTVLTGEVGTGKTTLLYSLLSEIGSEIETSYVANTTLEFDEILQASLKDLGVESAGNRRVDLLEALNQYLLSCSEAGRTVALIVDEAQALSVEAFEGLRQLLNFETYDKKLLQILLVGQPELSARLKERRLRQVADRVAIRCHLEPLRTREAERYIAHRLETAGASTSVFTLAARRLIVRASHRIPRSINVLGHNAMLFAFAAGRTRVDRSLVREAIKERRGRSNAPLSLRLFSALRAWHLLAVALVLVVVFSIFSGEPEATGAAPAAATAASLEPPRSESESDIQSVDPVVPSPTTPETVEPPAPSLLTKTTTANLNLRSGPTLGEAVLFTLPQGTEVAVLNEEDEWSFVRAGSYTGWAKTSFLAVAGRIEARE